MLRSNPMKEYYNITMKEVYMGRFSSDEVSEDVRGLKYFAIYVPWSKTVQASLKTPVASDKKKALLTVVEDKSAGIMDPYPYFHDYVSLLHPETERFISKPCHSEKNLREFKKAYPNRTIWYYPAGSIANYNIGVGKIPHFFKNFAKLCGDPNWQKCTGQGLRKLCLTVAVDAGLHPIDVAAIARHSSLNSQASYVKDSQLRKGQRSIAVRAQLNERPTKKRDQKVTPKKKKPSPKETVDMSHEDNVFFSSLLPATEVVARAPKVSLDDEERKELMRYRAMFNKESPKKKSPPVNLPLPTAGQQHRYSIPRFRSSNRGRPMPMHQPRPQFNVPMYHQSPTMMQHPMVYAAPAPAPVMYQPTTVMIQQPPAPMYTAPVQYAPQHYASCPFQQDHWTYEEEVTMYDDPYTAFQPDQSTSEFHMYHNRYGHRHGQL